MAVYEWTGDEAHPKAARLVPVCIYDGQDLNDASIYLTHPEPLALESDVEYQLQRDGSAVGLFDIDTSAREQGGWVGYGKWRPLPKAKAAPTQVAKIDAEDDAQSDVPILHRNIMRRFGRREFWFRVRVRSGHQFRCGFGRGGSRS
ncbi:MAG: hypothetical protein WDM87_17395 [Terracidiphilus sp.]